MELKLYFNNILDYGKYIYVYFFIIIMIFIVTLIYRIYLFYLDTMVIIE